MYPEVYSDDKTEYEMMEELGIPRIYGCGLVKYALYNEINEVKNG